MLGLVFGLQCPSVERDLNYLGLDEKQIKWPQVSIMTSVSTQKDHQPSPCTVHSIQYTTTTKFENVF